MNKNKKCTTGWEDNKVESTKKDLPDKKIETLLTYEVFD